MPLRTEDGRPHPQALLSRISSEEPGSRGRLKVFLGYAAGVGKTYSMLKAGHQQLEQGVRVLLGLVETHNRPDTHALLEGLPLLPRQNGEFDLDGCLELKPELVLVDELAHSNPPGARHPKRYQDVEEVLNAGIDVYTTVNVQHLESLNDAVWQVTGVKVRETIPDTFLDRADSISLIDLPPDELLSRLREGNVYQGETIQSAQNNFFRPGNLAALRELSLRSAADRVDQDLNRYMHQRSIAGPWHVSERLLVAVGPSPFSEKLVRSARRLAQSLNAEWLAVSVRTGDTLSEDGERRLAHNLQLAESLGAQTEVIQGLSVPESLVQFARDHNVTKLVTGKPLGKSYWKADLVDQLIRLSGNIDVFVVSGEAAGQPSQRPAIPAKPSYRYLLAAALTLSVTACCLPMRAWLAPVDLVMVYLLTVVLLAYRLGRGPSVLASALSVALFDFVFIPPYYTLAVYDKQYFITFSALLSVSLSTSYLTAKAREQAQAARNRETETAALFALSRSLAEASGAEKIGQLVAEKAGQQLQTAVTFLLPEPPSWPANQSVHQRGVAMWVLANGKRAGLGTDTLSDSPSLVQPILSPEGSPLGLLHLHPEGPLTSTQSRLLDTFAHQAALALEREKMAQKSKETELLQASEKLQTALLNSISHDLRIPLVSIQGALQNLQEESFGRLEAADRKSLIDNALEETSRLNRIVENLLQMTRLESGHLRASLQPQDLAEIVSAAVQQLDAPGRIELDLEPELSLVEADFLLLQQALVNLLDNALKFSSGRVEVKTRKNLCWIRDYGPGISQGDLSMIFDKFYRGQSQVSGSGLGLSIARGLIESLGGTLTVENANPGARFCVQLKQAQHD